MNRRIKELAKLADPGFQNKFGDMADSIVGLDAVERFAELIVQECVKACIEEGNKWRGGQDITDFKLCAHVIKEHFGIKNERTN
mgnify:CR=1 FL=1